MIKIIKKSIIFIFFISLFSVDFTHAYGNTNIESQELKPKVMEETSNGAHVNFTLGETNENKMDVDLNTKGLDSGYYSTYLYENKKRDWSNFEAIAFDIENGSDNAISINFNIKENDDTVVSVSDDNIVLIKRENTEILEITHLSYGTVEISKNFKGTIYIPFNSFQDKDKNERLISKILSWGIVVTLPENEEANFKLGKFELINKGSDIGKYTKDSFSINGDKIIEIPTAGESFLDYKVEFSSKENQGDVKFGLLEDVNGVNLSEDGRITLNSEAEPQKIHICAKLEHNISQTMEVELIKSWTVNTKEEDGTRKGIPKAGEVESIISNKSNLLINKNILIGIRTITVLTFLIFLVLYTFWAKQKK